MKDIMKNRGAKRSVLIVDDELINREILGNMLIGEYEVVYAENGKEALDLLKNAPHRFSLMLLDLLMPVMNGYDLLDLVRSDPAFDALPVIVMTQESSAEVDSIKAGAADFISKPYNRPEVIQARCARIIDLYEKKTIISKTETDDLTGLYSKEFFFEYIRTLDQAGAGAEMDAMVLNIEHFHLINEIFGRRKGDSVLRTVADVLNKQLDGNVWIGSRTDADTFYVYLNSLDDYQELADAITKETYDISHIPARIRIRMGIYKAAGDADTPENIFDHANLACNQLRGDYSRQVNYYDSALHDKQLYHEQLIHDIDSSIANKDFIVYYQPKYGIQSEEPHLRSAEALIRWNHPKLGMISPGDFIPLFEGNGLVQKLDRYVWEEAAAQIRKWRDKFGITVPVSVNVSRIDIYDPMLEENLLKIIDDNGITTDDMMLEITESAYSDNASRLIEVINDLRKKGFKIEMDDFGSGYSSLNMLTTIPIDILKMDMKFVRNMLKDEKSLKLTELVMDISEFLDVPVVAEGVEDIEQLQKLKEMGCEIIQGYYFSKPVPPEEFEQFIEKEGGPQK